MLIVQLDGTLDGVVRDGVAVCEILGYDAGAGLVLLRDVVGI